jgi:hypothetical protein
MSSSIRAISRLATVRAMPRVMRFSTYGAKNFNDAPPSALHGMAAVPLEPAKKFRSRGNPPANDDIQSVVNHIEKLTQGKTNASSDEKKKKKKKKKRENAH